MHINERLECQCYGHVQYTNVENYNFITSYMKYLLVPLAVHILTFYVPLPTYCLFYKYKSILISSSYKG